MLSSGWLCTDHDWSVELLTNQWYNSSSGLRYIASSQWAPLKRSFMRGVGFTEEGPWEECGTPGNNCGTYWNSHLLPLSVGKVFGSSHSQVPQANQKKPGFCGFTYEKWLNKISPKEPGSCSWRICRFPMSLRPGKQQIFRRWLELEEASLICKDFSGSTTLDERKQRSKTWTALMIPKCHEICWCVGFDFCLDLIQN